MMRHWQMRSRQERWLRVSQCRRHINSNRSRKLSRVGLYDGGVYTFGWSWRGRQTLQAGIESSDAAGLSRPGYLGILTHPLLLPGYCEGFCLTFH